MRSEREMMGLILEIAKQDERVRAVILNGSRANPNARKDIFQDFDIVYVVTEVAAIKNNPDWVSQFGELMIMQLPEEMQDPPPADDGSYAYLMQFADGNRIDLTLCPISKVDELTKDSLSVLLLDKDRIIPPFPSPNEKGYLPVPPTAKLFADCCNEFWWVSTYVAKGLWREEITYAKAMQDEYVRPQLFKMLAWYIGIHTGFEVNPGKLGKSFQQYLDPAMWKMLLATYADADYGRTWDALAAMCRLFRKASRFVADHFGFAYPTSEDENVIAHLKRMRSLPKDAKEYKESGP